jgi:septum site-determining protein MinD
MITSFKGGVGKSTAAANLAFALASNGKKTLLIDCDFRMRSLDIMLGFEDEIINDAYDVMSGRTDLDKAVIRDKRSENLFFLPAPFNCQTGMDSRAFGLMLKEAEKRYFLDYIVFDTPGSSGQEFSVVSEHSDMALIIATHFFPSIRAAECTGTELETLGVSDTRLIIIMIDMSGRFADRTPSVLDVIDKTNIRLAGIIPYDSGMVFMQDRGELIDVAQSRNISKAFFNICKRLEGKNVPLFTGFKGINRKKLLNN